MSRHFIALTPYEFQIVFVNEFTNCYGGMWVGVNDGTQMPNQEMFALLFKAGVSEAWSPEGRRVLGCQCPYSLVPEVLLLCYWIGLNIFALTLLEKERKLNLNIVKAASMGSRMNIPVLAPVLSLICFAISFLNQHQDHLLGWVWRNHFSMQDQHLGPARRTIGTFSAALYSLPGKGIHPYCENVLPQSLIGIPIAFASFIYCCCLCILKYWSVQQFLWDISYMLPAWHTCALISK